MMLFLYYVKEKFAWILFYVLLQLLFNILVTIDISFANTSIIYMNSISLVAFLVFFLWRFFQETKLIRGLLKLQEHDSTLDELLEKLPVGRSSFEKIMMSKLQEVIQVGKQELNDSKTVFLEEKDQTLSWIHEMKTPLTSMKLVIDSVHDPKLKRTLNIDWLRIHMLLDQQLHNTRLPSIEKDNVIEEINVEKLIFREIKELKPWCMQRHIGFETEDLDQVVVTDQKWLSFIVRQLLSNAVKYSKENSEIRIYTKKEKSGRMVLSIEDKGIGITPADLPRIFDKSFTGKIGRESTASTGMGLYLAKNAAEKLGIKIRVNSTADVGSTFSIHFPLQNDMQQILGR